MIPNLSRAYAVLLGGEWIPIHRSEQSDLEGWIILHTDQFSRIPVKEESITACRYRELPDQAEKQIFTPWES